MVRRALTVLDALIFDLDGVITATSAEYHYQSWQQLADEEHLPFSREDNERLRGVNRMESLSRFLNGRVVSASQRQDYLERKQRYYLALLDGMTAADRLSGVVELLDSARAEGIPLGVASASRNADVVLEKLDLRHYFDVVSFADCVANPKPAPDIFLWIAGYLRARVAYTVILEDSLESILTAKAAGFWTVGVGLPADSPAHLSVPDLTHVRLADFRAEREA
jgi:beta-phosphoglucomutase